MFHFVLDASLLTSMRACWAQLSKISAFCRAIVCVIFKYSASDEHGEYLIVRGTNLSTRNLLRYFQYAEEGETTAEEEANICSDRKYFVSSYLYRLS